ncbi:hypothetical protein LBMAG42_24150 [Deltaproteobacteria bacterium]|nr:hypothetical protein LBMAG42_24150 [Deltaproteobacteria bacterium]
MFISSTLLALVLATPDAEAHGWPSRPKRYVPRAVLLDLEPGVLDSISATMPAGEATSITADITSASGSESVDLSESDA